MLTKSEVYAVVREVINYKKTHNQTTDVTTHIGDARFASVLFQFIKEHADRIAIKHSEQLTASVVPHVERLNYLFNLPTDITEEYNYCIGRRRNGGNAQD